MKKTNDKIIDFNEHTCNCGHEHSHGHNHHHEHGDCGCGHKEVDIFGMYDEEDYPMTDYEKAQELVFEAYEAIEHEEMEEAVGLVQHALSIYPNCGEAYILMSNIAFIPQMAEPLLEKAIEVETKNLGKSFIKKNKGDFWMFSEARTYMTALAELADLKYADLGKKQEAIKLYEELIELNAGDNQGIRYRLFNFYIEQKMFDEANKIFTDYTEDTAEYLYPNALYKFAINDKEADQILEKAIKSNKHIPNYILGKKKLPKEMPTSYSRGDETEALSYYALGKMAWDNVEGAKEWLESKNVKKK